MKYFGDSLTKQNYWLLEITHIHESHRLEEPELQSVRWFDYRRMLPAQATYLFAHHYSQIYLEFYRRTVDVRTVDTVKPFAPEDIFFSKDITAMWLARQAVDRLSCKYDFYLRNCFEIFISRGWRNLPRPNQLYTEELSIDITRMWESRCNEVLQLATDPFYFESSYVFHPDQNAYYDWLIGQIKQREQKHIALSGVLRHSKILPYEVALREFGIETCNRALKF